MRISDWSSDVCSSDLLGFKPVAGESSEDAILRTDLITYLGAMGDRTVLAAAQERFAKLDHDPAALNGPLQTAWLGVIARHARKAEWGKLRQMANAAPSQLEKSSRSEERRVGKAWGST